MSTSGYSQVRIWQYGLLASILAAIANVGVLYVGLWLGADFAVPQNVDGEALPLNALQLAIATIIPLIVGTGFFSILAWRSATPLKVFQTAALIILLISFIPSFLIAQQLLTQWLLSLTHVVAAGALLLAMRRAADGTALLHARSR